jgi:flagellar biosynthesis protein FlhG
MSVSELAPGADAAPVTRSAPFVLVTGGKGGVGKSTLTADLGVHLAAQGLRVLLVDLDLGLANLDVLLGLGAGRNVEDALEGRCEFEDCVVTGPEGVHVLPAGSGTADMGRPDGDRRARLLEAIGRLSARYDLVIGDSAAGIGHDVLGFAAAADHVLVVTTPQAAALTDAYGLIKALDTWAHEAGVEVPTPEVLVNLVSGLDEADATARRLQRVCERFLCRRPRAAGWLPSSAGRPVPVRGAGQSLIGGPNSLYHNCLARIAGRVQRWLEGPVAVPAP